MWRIGFVSLLFSRTGVAGQWRRLRRTGEGGAPASFLSISVAGRLASFSITGNGRRVWDRCHNDARRLALFARKWPCGSLTPSGTTAFHSHPARTAWQFLYWGAIGFDLMTGDYAALASFRS
jgi:hypothetical protein